MAQQTEADIRDLAVIGDRRTAALVARDGAILWYCPERFDYPSLFAGLLDPAGGAWSVHLPGGTPGPRRYLEESGVLETRLCTPTGDLIITDWMPAGQEAPKGLLCRRLSPAPEDTRVVLEPRPDYARRKVSLAHAGGAVVINGSQHLYSSHPLSLEEGTVSFTLPKGQEGWAVLADRSLDGPTAGHLDSWLAATLDHWRATTRNDSYSGPYEREVADSVRAIRLMCHAESGGIIAAATTSLPEVAGGARNWDYRYVWLRDAGMNVSALTRLGGDVVEARRYLDFICSARGSSSKYPVAVFTDLEGKRAPEEEVLELAGYLGSRPVRIGNNARDQLQLDAFANVLLAAKLIYQHSDERPHWDAVEEMADFLAEHWREPDYGIWEEKAKLQYTSNKVIVACALESVAEFSTDEAQAARWKAAVQDIRDFVASHCLTSQGAYAVHAGSEDVDVSAALIPIWGYTAADAPEMRATMVALERDHSREGLLYWRRLECADSRKEGVFLAGTFWVAQYWIMRGELDRARRILDAALAYANDLGLLAEEADPRSGRMLGNIPQTFVHAAFIGVAVDLKAALESQDRARSAGKTSSGGSPKHEPEAVRHLGRGHQKLGRLGGHQPQSSGPWEDVMTKQTAADGYEADNLLRGLAAGLVAGVTAAYVMNTFQGLVSRFKQDAQGGSDKQGDTQGGSDEQGDNPDQKSSDQDHSDEDESSESSEPTTMRAASAVSEDVFGHQLSSAEKKVAGPTVHYALGATLGGLYGVAAELKPEVTSGAGMPFGAAVALVLDEGVVPAVGLSGPPWGSPASTQAYSLVSHLVFGLTTEITRRTVRNLLT